MPTQSERVPNRALSGTELKALIRADCEVLLGNEGLLSDYVAFGRVAYDITLRLHLDNPVRPESTIRVESRRVGVNVVAERPELGAMEPPPLGSPSKEAAVVGRERFRTITSPNVERVRSGMPIPVEVKQQDGTVTTEQIKYPPDPSYGEGEVVERDVTREVKDAWKVE